MWEEANMAAFELEVDEEDAGKRLDVVIAARVPNLSRGRAKAMIDGETVVVWSDEVAEPQNVRYAYDSHPRANLYNKEGLPASPFTTVD